jgi:hypothetical protein
VQRFTPLTPAGATPESYLQTTTPILQAGLYRVTPVLVVIGSAAGTDILAIVEIDGQPLNLLTEASVAGGGFILSGLGDQDFSAGDAAHTFEFFVAQPSGPGVVTAVGASFAWERKA